MRAALAAALLLGACATTPSDGLPRDVRAFADRWESCAHFLGEEAYDAERGAFLTRSIARTCPGIDALAQRLRAKYAGNERVSAALARHEALGQ